jgi:hypothetical protein
MYSLWVQRRSKISTLILLDRFAWSGVRRSTNRWLQSFSKPAHNSKNNLITAFFSHLICDSVLVNFQVAVHFVAKSRIVAKVWALAKQYAYYCIVHLLLGGSGATPK